jgi:hypothetical protein
VWRRTRQKACRPRASLPRSVSGGTGGSSPLLYRNLGCSLGSVAGWTGRRLLRRSADPSDQSSGVADSGES